MAARAARKKAAAKAAPRKKSPARKKGTRRKAPALPAVDPGTGQVAKPEPASVPLPGPGQALVLEDGEYRLIALSEFARLGREHADEHFTETGDFVEFACKLKRRDWNTLEAFRKAENRPDLSNALSRLIRVATSGMEFRATGGTLTNEQMKAAQG